MYEMRHFGFNIVTPTFLLMVKKEKEKLSSVDKNNKITKYIHEKEI